MSYHPPLGYGIVRRMILADDKIAVVLYTRSEDESRATAARYVRKFGHRVRYIGADVMPGGTVHTYQIR